MSTNSSIEWTDTTWNPVAGCSIVSPGCKNCYAMRMAARLEAMGQAKYAGLTQKKNGKHVWTGKINLDEAALSHPFGWKKPRMVFVNSMSDLFHEDVPFDFVDKVFAVMALTPQHTYQILTKRPARMAQFFERRGVGPDVLIAALKLAPPSMNVEDTNLNIFEGRWAVPNVWLGCSPVNQKTYDDYSPCMARVPSIRFYSLEPLLGPIKLDGPEVDWLIIGGESGPGARACHVDWIRDLLAQAKAFGIPAFVKQVGENPAWGESEIWEQVGPPRDRKGGAMEEWPQDLRVREFPKVTVPV